MFQQILKLTFLLLLPIGLFQCSSKKEEEEEELLFKFDEDLNLPRERLTSPQLPKAVGPYNKPISINVAVRARNERIKLGAYDSTYQFLVEKLQRIEDGSYKYGDIINTPDKANNNCTALHYAVKLQKPAIIQILLELNAKVDIKDANGKTPLDWVAQEQQPNLEIIQLAI